MAAKRIAVMGSRSKGPNIRGSVSEPASGAEASLIRDSDSTIRPTPIIARKRWRLRPAWSLRIWPMIPIISKAGDNHVKFNVKTCATSVVEMSEPMTTASAIARGMVFFLTKDMSKSAVAVELWTMAVTPIPDAQATNLFLVPDVMKRRKDVPYARVKPSLTIRVPQRRRQTAPAICSSVYETGISFLRNKGVRLNLKRQ
jgi:hypothetical protein